MPIARYYFLGACACALIAILPVGWPVRLLALWSGSNLLAVAVAYRLNYPELFRKRENGSLSIWVRWLFWPVIAGVRLYNYSQRRQRSFVLMDQILSDLYVAGRSLPSDIDEITQKNITAVLDVTAEFATLDWSAAASPVDYLNVPVLDHSVPTIAQLNRALTWIHRQRQNDNTVLVHCALGRGRSVMVVAAYLLCLRPEASVDDILESIRKTRSVARLNKKQLRVLKQYQQEGLIGLNKQAWIIANPVAGGGKWESAKEPLLNALKPYFDIRVQLTSPEISAGDLAADAAGKRVHTIVVCGGDGTLSEAAGAIVNSDIHMGIIPLGTTNALAHSLWGIQSKLSPIDTGCQLIVEGHIKAIDTASCNDKPMLLLSALGFEQRMIESADREEKNMSGQLAYLKGLYDAVCHNEALQLTLYLDDQEPIAVSSPSLVIANASPLTSILAQGNGEPDLSDGLLDITWLEASNESLEQWLKMLQLGLSSINPAHQAEGIHHRQVRKIKVECDTDHYALDGELHKDLPITVELIPQSLKVYAPKPA